MRPLGSAAAALDKRNACPIQSKSLPGPNTLETIHEEETIGAVYGCSGPQAVKYRQMSWRPNPLAADDIVPID